MVLKVIIERALCHVKLLAASLISLCALNEDIKSFTSGHNERVNESGPYIPTIWV